MGRLNSRHGLRRDEDKSWLAATVQLDEGPRVVAAIEGVQNTAVKVGARVRFDRTRISGDRLPVFRLSLEPESAATSDPSSPAEQRTGDVAQYGTGDMNGDAAA